MYTQSNVLYIGLVLVMPNEERQNVLPEATAEGLQQIEYWQQRTRKTRFIGRNREGKAVARAK